MKKFMKRLFYYVLSSLLIGGFALTAVSCTDDIDVDGPDGKGMPVRFSVNDVQEGAINQGKMLRGTLAPGLGSHDLAGRKLAARSNHNLNVCLIETTVEGVNPVKADYQTRAQIIKTATLGDFSVSGIRGTASSGILTTPEWFHTKKAKPNGELYTPIFWDFDQPKARFFAVHPNAESYTKMTISNTATTGSPSVDFEVESNVKQQVDLMTACTGDVEYATRGVQPQTNLDFRHALTGIRFAVGQNLSWNKTIDKVELRNAVMKSKYVLSKQFDGTGADWDHSSDTRGTAVLSGVSVSTSENPNVTIMGTTGDNYTFYMIPQVLTGNNVIAYVHCTDGTEITVPLKGEWKAGTTRTYKLSQINSTWTYTLTAQDPSRAAYFNEVTSQPYGIISYREAPDGTQQAVPWKVIGYSVDGGATWTTQKPVWVTDLSAESGAGGTSADQGTATLKVDVINRLAQRNNELKNATALGTSAAPYDLSLHNYKGVATARNTANSYLISAPGHYRIPLVYGNAIENGVTNDQSYISQAPSTSYEFFILRHFKDHDEKNITDPWIEKTNGGANAGVDGAKIVWADAADLVHLSATPIARDASGNAFLDFEVKASDIQSGNAVVAVMKGGTVVWSWHLWFAPKDALNTIEVTNHQNIKYNFTKETLGWKPTQWSGSSYDQARTVKVKVEQTIANNGTKQVAIINITQEPGIKRTGATTLYQFGRKDAFPGVETNALAAGSSLTENAGYDMSIKNGIQNPDKFYTWGGGWHYSSYANNWSMNNTLCDYNDNVVVKTIYDPCPAGFKMPASNAFSGFTENGQNQGAMNVNGTSDEQQNRDNFGHNFWTNSSKTISIYFPASGIRSYMDGGLGYVGKHSGVWTAIPKNVNYGCVLYFTPQYVEPVTDEGRPYGFAVRPVSE